MPLCYNHHDATVYPRSLLVAPKDDHLEMVPTWLWILDTPKFTVVNITRQVAKGGYFLGGCPAVKLLLGNFQEFIVNHCYCGFLVGNK